jgi:hypothetical protein
VRLGGCPERVGEKLASSCCRDVGELLLPSCVGELLLPSCVGELLLPLCGSMGVHLCDENLGDSPPLDVLM